MYNNSALRASYEEDIEYCESINFEQILLNISCSQPSAFKKRALYLQWIYIKKDPCMKILLQNGSILLIRMWKTHMLSSNESREKTIAWQVFLSAAIYEDHAFQNKVTNLPLYGWHEWSNMESIWEKIMSDSITIS